MTKNYQGPGDKISNVNQIEKEVKNNSITSQQRCTDNKGDKNKSNDKDKKENKKPDEKNQGHHQYGILAAAAACKIPGNKHEENNNRDPKHKDIDNKFEFCNDKVQNGKDVSHNSPSTKPCDVKNSKNDCKDDYKNDKDCEPKSHNIKPCEPKPSDPKPTHDKPCDYKPPVVNPCPPKPPVECKPVLKLNPEPCKSTPLNNINEDLQAATYQFQNLLLNDSSTGGVAIKIVAASLAVMGPGISIHAGTSTLGAANGFKTFDVKHDGYTATFKVYTTGKFELFGDINKTFNYLAEGQKLEFKLNYSVSNGYESKQTYAEVCLIGKNDKPIISVDDMCLALKGCEPCDKDSQLKDSSKVILKDVDYGDCVTFSVKFEGLKADCNDCIKEVKCDTYTAKELQKGVNIGDYFILKMVDGKLNAIALPGTDASKALAEGQNVEFKFSAIGTDKSGLSVKDPFKVTLKGANDAPELCITKVDKSIKLPDCDPCDNSKTDLLAGFNVAVKDPDCDDSYTLKFESKGAKIECGDCKFEIKPFSYTAEQLSGKGVEIGKGIWLSFNNGKAEIKADADNPALRKLGDDDILKLNIKVTATDKEGCKDIETVDIKIKGGNDAPEICITDKDLVVQAEDCQDDCVTPADLCASFDVDVKDVDCDDSATLKFESKGATVDCGDCKLEIPPFCYTAADLAGVGKEIADGIFINFNDGEFKLTAKDGSPLLMKLAAGQELDLGIKVTATDESGCTDVAEETIKIKGGNDAPELKIDDLCVQLPDCCDENPAENVCTDVIISDPDCGDEAQLAKVVLYGFGEEVNKDDPIAWYTMEDLIAGVDISDYGTLSWKDGKLCFDVNEENQDLKQMKDGEKFTIAFGAFAFDGDCYSEQDCFNVTIKGANDGPTDEDELCCDEGGNGPKIGENGEILVGDMNLLDNASDPENDPLFVSAVAVPIIMGDYSPGEITVSAFDPNSPFTYTITSASGTSLLTVAANGDVTLVATDANGKGAFDFLDDGEKVRISFDYTVSDGKCTDDSKAEICIDGEGDDKFYIPDGFSNLVLYMLDPDAEWQSGDATDEDAVLKVIFDQSSGTLPGLDTNGDGYVSSSEIDDYIANDPNDILGDHTQLIAFSLHNGNFLGVTPYNTGYEPNNGTNIGNTNGDILKAGEGQLVFMDDSGFEVNATIPPVPPSDDLTTANAWLDSLQQDVVFSPQLAGQSSYTSVQLAGTILDPATALGAAILANNPVDG